MAERIFISYRRDDSAGHAGRVFDRLKTDFGQDVLFMDVDAIPLGANFVRVLREEVAKCSALLAIIGPNWLNSKDEDGARRLDNPNDFVRIEIGAALQRDIPVIPILLEGARIPRTQALPDDLKELSERNGLEVRHASFHADMDKLVKGLRSASVSAAAQTYPTSSQLGGTGQPVSPLIVPRMPILRVDEVIAAKGQWVKRLRVDLSAKVAPEIFGHLFILLNNLVSFPAGTILRGKSWHANQPHQTWQLVHGFSGSSPESDWTVIELAALTYLGPTWQSAYAQLSTEVFKKLGDKPRERFIKYG